MKDLSSSSNSPFITKKQDFKNKYQPIYNKKYIEIAKNNIIKSEQNHRLNNNKDLDNENDENDENDAYQRYLKEEYNPQKENRSIYKNMIKTEKAIKENSLNANKNHNTKNINQILRKSLNVQELTNKNSHHSIKKDKELLELKNATSTKNTNTNSNNSINTKTEYCAQGNATNKNHNNSNQAVSNIDYDRGANTINQDSNTIKQNSNTNKKNKKLEIIKTNRLHNTYSAVFK